MIQIRQAIPDPEVLIALSPEELGYQIIAAVKAAGGDTVHPSSLVSGLFGSEPGAYPQTYRNRVELALLEGWAWLESEALLVMADAGGANGWCRPSRRALALQDPKAFAEFQTSRVLPRTILHPNIRERVWMNFARGDFDLAVFEAMRAVEIAIRAATGSEEIGVKLMRFAFHPERGPLADLTVEPGERQARMDLFAGALGWYKNLESHRHVALEDTAEAIE